MSPIFCLRDYYIFSRIPAFNGFVLIRLHFCGNLLFMEIVLDVFLNEKCLVYLCVFKNNLFVL